MREVEGPHQAWTEDEKPQDIAPQLVTTGPTETEMLTITLLMRLYDVQITLLEHFDKDVAEQLWQKHNNGEHFNPAIFLPVMKNDE